MTSKRLAIFLIAVTLCHPAPVIAFGPDELPVKFHDYSPKTFELSQKSDKPVFMLFSAQWCHWCKILEARTLKEKKVYSYLNDNFINVFIDADMRSDLVAEYDVSYLPYTIFLKPDQSVHYKYGGTLYPDDFYGLIKKMRGDILAGSKKETKPEFVYIPPKSLDTESLKNLEDVFIKTALDNFDGENYGIGDRVKTILPYTFVYLLEHTEGAERKEARLYVTETMKKAATFMFDQVEGGFFRYTETAEWKTPHYEKMLDTNAGAARILSMLKETEKSPSLATALDKTYRYLGERLFIQKAGLFASFQIADDAYYLMDARQRKKQNSPAIVRKIYTDRFAEALSLLVDIKPSPETRDLKKKIKSSLLFLAKMVKTKSGISHFYSIDQKKWSYPGMLADHAGLALLFAKAYKSKGDEMYRAIATEIVDDSIRKFYNKKRRVFADKLAANRGDFEYQMAQNGKLIHAITLLDPKGKREEWKRALDGSLTFFSGVDAIFEERAWNAANFLFMEKYAPYLFAIKSYNTSIER